jgi:acetyltransferase-like isoleucine patch superfamily enzyme
VAPIRAAAAAVHNSVFFWRKDGRLVWTGWGVVRAAALTGVPPGVGEQNLAGRICAPPEDTRIVEVGQPLSVGSYAEVIESNRRALCQDHPDLLRRGKEVRPGLWLGRNVKIHPTAELVSPAFVGDNTRLEAGVQVGPATVIGRDCVIDRHTLVSNSVIGNGSYVGEGLDLKSVFVDRSKLINTRLDAAIDGVDECLLGSVRRSPVGHLRMACEAVLAMLILLSMLPLLALIAVLSKVAWGPALRKKSVVRTPAVTEPFRWKTFDIWYFGNEGGFGCFGNPLFFALPALIHVASGRLALVGPQPLSIEELKELPDRKRLKHLRLRAGILQGGDRRHDDNQPARQRREAARDNDRDDRFPVFSAGRAVNETGKGIAAEK